jgi:hypothetical protein
MVQTPASIEAQEVEEKRKLSFLFGKYDHDRRRSTDTEFGVDERC